jgi:prepilin-type N-terminal cleavage/methylation domain-containing protein
MREEIGSRHCHQRGMTILEVVISLALAGIVLSIALPSIVQSYRRFSETELRTRAARLAVSKAEELSLVANDISFPSQGQVDELLWRVDAGDGSGHELSMVGQKTRLQTYRISVFQRGRSALVSMSITRIQR